MTPYPVDCAELNHQAQVELSQTSINQDAGQFVISL